MSSRAVTVLGILLSLSLMVNVMAYRSLGEVQGSLGSQLSLLQSRLQSIEGQVGGLQSKLNQIKQSGELVQNNRCQLEGGTATLSWLLASEKEGQRVSLLYRKRGEPDWREASVTKAGPEYAARVPVENRPELDVSIILENSGDSRTRQVQPVPAQESKRENTYEYTIVIAEGNARQTAGPYFFPGAKPRHVEVRLQNRGNDGCALTIMHGEGLQFGFKAIADGQVLDELTVEAKGPNVTQSWQIPAKANRLTLTVRQDGGTAGEYAVPWEGGAKK